MRAREIMLAPGRTVEANVANPIDAYCEWLVAHGRSQNTANSRRHLLHKMLDETTGDRSNVAVRADQARLWFEAQVRRLHPSTAASTLQTVRHFHGWLIDRDLAKTHPWDGLKPPIQRAGARHRILTRQDCRRLMVAARGDREMRFVLLCALHGGLRKEEIIEARPEWFDLAAGLLHIRASSTWQPKDRENRTVPLTREFRRFLSTWPMPGPWCIAPHIQPGKWRYRYEFRRRWVAVRERAGLPADIRFHDLRRTFASFLVSRGVSIYKVAKWLGDGVAVVERHYGHLIPSDDEINAAWE